MTISVTAVPNGFSPARPYHFDQLRTYPVTLNANQQLGIGDAVTLADGIVVPVTAGQNPTSPGFGVVVGVLDTNGKPLTFNQPTRGPYLTSGASGQAIIAEDVNLTFNVRYEGSAGNDVVGSLVEVTAGAPQVTNLTGISTMRVQAATSADTSLLFKVLALGTDPITGGKGSPKYVEVAWNRHLFRAGTAGV